MRLIDDGLFSRIMSFIVIPSGKGMDTSGPARKAACGRARAEKSRPSVAAPGQHGQPFLAGEIEELEQGAPPLRDRGGQLRFVFESEGDHERSEIVPGLAQRAVDLGRLERGERDTERLAAES